MSVFESCPTTPPVLRAELPLLDEAQLAAAAFLARYRGRTRESYRADLRQFFQWADDVGLAPLTATRAHVELYRATAGGTRARGLHDRPPALHRVWLLPLRTPRRQDRRQPGPICPPSSGPSVVTAGHGPWRARRIPLHGRAGLADARRSGRPPRPQRAPRQRSLRLQHRRPRL